MLSIGLSKAYPTVIKFRIHLTGSHQQMQSTGSFKRIIWTKLPIIMEVISMDSLTLSSTFILRQKLQTYGTLIMKVLKRLLRRFKKDRAMTLRRGSLGRMSVQMTTRLCQQMNGVNVSTKTHSTESMTTWTIMTHDVGLGTKLQ